MKGGEVVKGQWESFLDLNVNKELLTTLVSILLGNQFILSYLMAPFPID